jgi:hypothetical protein
MASNTNCRQCTPAPNVCITPPPVCEGCECEEIYSGECVQYTGQDLDCLGITRGMSFNEIIQILADKLCIEGCCINPVQWLFDYVIEVYNIAYDKGHMTALRPLTLNDILKNLLGLGIVVPKCNLCCPDCGVYVLGSITAIEAIQTATGSSCCINCGQDYNQCYSALTKLYPCAEYIFEEYEIQEFGTLGTNTILCTLQDILANYNANIVCDILETIGQMGLVISCNNPNGAIVISSAETFLDYYTNTNLTNPCDKHPQ